jgi:hypothetical protein
MCRRSGSREGLIAVWNGVQFGPATDAAAVVRDGNRLTQELFGS